MAAPDDTRFTVVDLAPGLWRHACLLQASELLAGLVHALRFDEQDINRAIALSLAEDAAYALRDAKNASLRDLSFSPVEQ
jgi:hypothetical protein